jgi:hypothetical protein
MRGTGELLLLAGASEELEELEEEAGDGFWARRGVGLASMVASRRISGRERRRGRGTVWVFDAP